MRTDVKIINLKWILRKIIIPTLNKRGQVVRNMEVAGRGEVVETEWGSCGDREGEMVKTERGR